MSVTVETFSDGTPTIEVSVEAGVDVEVYDAGDVAVVDTGSTEVVEVLDGAPGPPGNDNFFIQDEAPDVAPGLPYVWFQTGLPDGGMTLWVEDGT